jgi:rhamnogalacturonyl hydrolase YesR
VDNFHVHNANLFIAESLIRVGAEIDTPEFVQMGMKALNYTIAEQNSDGSFYYWGPPDKLLYNIDHYHTGFVLRALYSMYKITKDQQLFPKIEKCYHHYLENLFEDNMIPKLKPDSKYPINIHSCAEAILCLSTLSEDFPEGLETLERTATWTIENMQDKKGYFYYVMHPNRTIKIPYIRWAQAWMLNALSMYYKIQSPSKGDANEL